MAKPTGSVRGSAVLSIPEVAGLSACPSMIRIPRELNVPFTDRVRRLVDTGPFRRLERIRQLGLVSLVYPGATHSRFEHSLGVYRTALLFLRQLAPDPRFAAVIDTHDAELLIVSALLHDLGHWPFCHPIEDLHLEVVPQHESFAAHSLRHPEIARLLADDWAIDPEEVITLLASPPHDVKTRVLSSLLSGPIDVDKLDYLQRDSLHAGVPYGLHFDEARLISSFCLNEAGDGLAITEKGKTAAELMVFARYVMFSEVYWHNGVRSATAMLQRVFFELREDLDLDVLFRLTESEFISALFAGAENRPERNILDGLFGPRRRLYKQVAQYSCFERRELYEKVARRPYPWLVACARELATRLSAQGGLEVAPHEILIDAPPVEKEVEFRIEVFFPKEGRYRLLQDVSPVVRALAEEQFDDYVKRVRVYAHARVADRLREHEEFPGLLRAATARVHATCRPGDGAETENGLTEESWKD